MLFESTQTLLRSIVHSLEHNEESRWDDHLESGNQCLYELHQMSRQSQQAYRVEKSNGRPATVTPFSEKAIRAIPHVKLMMSAIRRRDQTAAIENGRIAIVEMSGCAPSRLVAPAPEPVVMTPLRSTAPRTEAVKTSRQQQKSAGKLRSRVIKKGRAALTARAR
jgi:hypothetical protein